MSVVLYSAIKVSALKGILSRLDSEESPGQYQARITLFSQGEVVGDIVDTLQGNYFEIDENVPELKLKEPVVFSVSEVPSGDVYLIVVDTMDASETDPPALLYSSELTTPVTFTLPGQFTLTESKIKFNGGS